MIKKIFVIIFFFIIISDSFSQGFIGFPLYENYSYKDYHAHYQNWEALQTQDGLMFFANSDGLLVFDGSKWQVLNTENTLRNIVQIDDGTIYVAGGNIFSKVSVSENGELKLISLINIFPDEYRGSLDIWDMATAGDSVIFRTTNFIFIVFHEKVVEIINVEGKRIYDIFYSVSNHAIYLNCRNELYKITDSQLVSLNFQEQIIYFYNKNDSTYFFTIESRIYRISKNDEIKFVDSLEYNLSGISFGKIQLYKEKYLLFSTANKGLIVVDFNGNLIAHLDKNAGLPSDNTYFAYIDNKDNIWFGSDNGLSYIELNSPLRVIDEHNGIDITMPLCLCDFNNSLYVNTGYYFYKISLNNYSPEIKKINIRGQVWDGIVIDSNLYITHNTQIYKIDTADNLFRFGPGENIWKIIKIPYWDNKFLISSSNGIYRAEYKEDSLYIDSNMIFSGSVRDMAFDSLNNLWLYAPLSGLYKTKLTDSLTLDSLFLYDDSKGLSEFSSMQLFPWRDKMFISVYKTLFIYNYKNDTIYPYYQITGNFDLSGKKILQLIQIDNNDNFWFEYYDENFNSRVFALKYENGEFVEQNNYGQRMFNFTVSFIKNITDNTLIFGAGKGLALLDLNTNWGKEVYEPYNVLIRKVQLLENDSVVFGGYSIKDSSLITCQADGKIIISYKNHNIKIEFSAPFFIESKNTQYRFMLENYDEKWSAWTFETKKDYTNLPPGNYIFKVQALNIFDQKSKIATIKITVKAPWYRTTLAYIVYFLLFVLLIYGLVQFFTFRLKKRNEKLEAIVDERTREIKLKNAELEQQKEEILTQAEELQVVNNELEKLSTIVRQTDNAVILTDKDGNFVWINSAFTKIFGYTFDELVNEISPNIISDNTDPEIRQIIQKCLTEKITVEYELKVRNKFDKEIWVHTTLTPILDEDDQVASLVAIDSDITKIKIAEKQILEQRDQITASIRYARTIQESVLPAQSEISQFFDNFIIFKPKDIVSGDFYWMSNLFRTQNGRLTRVLDKKLVFKPGYTLFFAVVDCTGHGVPGAFMSLIGNHLLGEIINEERFDNPKVILQQLDYKLSRVLKRSQTKNYDGMVVSLCRFDKYLDNDAETVKVTFAGSKQHITYYKLAEKKFVKLRGSARQIGFVINEDIEFFTQEFTLQKDDYLFLYSDGLKDLNSPQRDSFGYSRIVSILSKNIDKPIDEIKKILEDAMNNWLQDDLQRDDITFIGLKI